MSSFDSVPRIPLGPKADNRRQGRRASEAGTAGHGEGSQWPPPLPPPPVSISPSGGYLFSGGHPSGAMLVWQFDPSSGQVRLASHDPGLGSVMSWGGGRASRATLGRWRGSGQEWDSLSFPPCCIYFASWIDKGVGYMEV